MKKGFTLLEVLLAIILMVTGIVSLLQAFSVGLVGGTENESELIALNLAQERMEDLRNLSYANIVNQAKAPVVGYPAFQREVLVTDPQLGLRQVTIIVSWYSKDSEMNVTLVTYISDT